jgi:primosomal protein N'
VILGVDFTTEDVGTAWLKYLPMACTAEHVALEALKAGVPAMQAAEHFAQTIRLVHGELYEALPIRVLGPIPMRVALINSLYRCRIVVKYRQGRDFRDFLRECALRYSRSRWQTKARWFIDLAGEPDN